MEYARLDVLTAVTVNSTSCGNSPTFLPAYLLAFFLDIKVGSNPSIQSKQKYIPEDSTLNEADIFLRS
jgi:hypothetical protein